jgi:hypothetical protein
MLGQCIVLLNYRDRSSIYQIILLCPKGIDCKVTKREQVALYEQEGWNNEWSYRKNKEVIDPRLFRFVTFL